MSSPTARWIVSLMLVSLVAGCAAQPPAAPPVDAAAIKAEITKIDEAFMAAVAARDTVSLRNYYAEDSHLLAPNAPRADGIEAVMAGWREFLAIPGLEMTGECQDVIVSQAGDMAIDLGIYHMKMTGPKGAPMEDHGKYVTVYKKTDAGWKSMVDTYNSDVPLPGMTK
jgi:ketosteroid isomerase-like protein